MRKEERGTRKEERGTNKGLSRMYEERGVALSDALDNFCLLSLPFIIFPPMLLICLAVFFNCFVVRSMLS